MPNNTNNKAVVKKVARKAVSKQPKSKEFDFGNANDAQKEAISTTEGPLLIIAGPGERVIIVIPHGSAVNTRASAA